MRDVQEQLSSDDLGDLDLSVSQLQEALYGLNRRIMDLEGRLLRRANPTRGTGKTMLRIAAIVFALGLVSPAFAQSFNEGYRKCEKCHEAEVDVWKKTKHFTGFQETQKKESA